MGYDNVRVFPAGYGAWETAGEPTEKQTGFTGYYPTTTELEAVRGSGPDGYDSQPIQ